MHLIIHVKTRQPKTKILSRDGDILKVALRAAPEQGKANVELVKFLTRHFKKPAYIVSGFTSAKKIVEIAD